MSFFIPILETRVLRYEAQFHVVDLTGTVLGHDEQRQTADIVALGVLPGM